MIHSKFKWCYTHVIKMELQRKLNRVLNSASSLFIVPGFSETKMQDIAKGANLAVGTLYSMADCKI
ncbi:hypothetical protein DQM20_11455 [Lactiplantibacillus plantarum]|uniref:TetR family transcriptional regulator n=1 Tax=Lactiplantibacillus plantarum TaxID=1590 RepID=UPI000E099C9D|nr:hypothetical protein DQM20_11455 [Lactiplantibacillus plantarum]